MHSMKNTLRVERAKHRISQEQLAEKIGVTKQTINKIEKNKTNPNILTVLKIAQYFRAKVEDIFFY